MNSGRKRGAVWLVNQFVPPDRAPTARLLGELAAGLEERGWSMRFVGCAPGYRAAPVAGWRRWWRDLKAHARLFWQSLGSPKPDIIICLSDPPALVFTMACAARWRSARLVYWPMDVYPEIAAALGALSARSFIYRAIRRAADWAVVRCASVVCLDKDMEKNFAAPGVKPGPAIAPWPPSDLVIPDAAPPPAGSAIRWIYSGNLGRAHEFETLLQAQRRLEDEARPFELVFQGGGAARAAAEKRAAELGLQRCHWSGYAMDEDLVSSLLASHVCVATQRPEMAGLLWPSKLALMEMLPRAVVWVGPVDGAIAQRLRARPGRNGLFVPGDHRGLAAWLVDNEEYLRGEAAATFATDALRGRLREARDRAITAWEDILTSLLA